MRAAGITLAIGVIVMLVGLGMVAGVVPQNLSAVGTISCTNNVLGCPSMVVAFSTTVSNGGLVGTGPQNTVTLSDHSTVGKVNVSSFVINWGDSSPPQSYGTSAGFTATHVYATSLQSSNYTITETGMGSYTYTPTGTPCQVIAGGCPSQTLKVTSTAVHVVGSSTNGGTGGCGTSCPALVANMSLKIAGANVTLVDHTKSVGMCSGLFGTPQGTVQWGDGSSSIVGVGGSTIHLYATGGTYIVSERMSGSFPAPGQSTNLCIGTNNGGSINSNATAPVSVSVTGPCTTNCNVVTNTVPGGSPSGLTLVAAVVLSAGVALLVVGLVWLAKPTPVIAVLVAAFGVVAIVILQVTAAGIPL